MFTTSAPSSSSDLVLPKIESQPAAAQPTSLIFPSQKKKPSKENAARDVIEGPTAKSPSGTPRAPGFLGGRKFEDPNLRAGIQRKPYGLQRDNAGREVPLPTRTLNDSIDTLVEAPSGPGALVGSGTAYNRPDDSTAAGTPYGYHSMSRFSSQTSGGAGLSDALRIGGGSDFISRREGAAQPHVEEPASCWVTVYGIPPEERELALKVLRSCGEILEYGTFGLDYANFFHAKFSSLLEAKKALSLNGKSISLHTIIGVRSTIDEHLSRIQKSLQGRETHDFDAVLPAKSTPSSASSGVPVRDYHIDTRGQAPVAQANSSWWGMVRHYVFGL